MHRANNLGGVGISLIRVKNRLGLGAGSQAPSAATSWAQPAVLGLRGRIRPWCNPAGCWLWVRPNTKWDRRETPTLCVPLWGDVCGPPLLVPRLPWSHRGAQLGDSGRGGCKEPWGQRTSPSQQDPKRCGAIWASSLPYGDKWRAACARTRLGSTGQHFWCAPSLQEHPAQPQQLPVPLGPAAVLPRHSQPKWLPQKLETAAPPRPAPCRRSAGVVTGRQLLPWLLLSSIVVCHCLQAPWRHSAPLQGGHGHPVMVGAQQGNQNSQNSGVCVVLGCEVVFYTASLGLHAGSMPWPLGPRSAHVGMW